MDLRSPSSAKDSFGREMVKESKMSARRLAATMWEINGLKSPSGGGREDNDSLQGDDRKTVAKSGELFDAELGHTHQLNQSCSPAYKNKDGSKLTRHRRKLSSNSQKLQLTEYLGEGMDYVTNGAFEVASPSFATIKGRLRDVSSSLAGSKEIVKALFRLWSQDGERSSRLGLVSALRVEIEQARHQVDQMIHEELYNESDTKALLKQFAAEKVAWKRREQDRIIDAISSVSRELEIEKKLRRQSERLNKRLGRELAGTAAKLSKAVKKLDRERRAREVLEQTYNELVGGLGEAREERVEVKLPEGRYEDEEKTAALERLRSDLEIYLGGKQSLDDNAQSGSCRNGEGVEEEEDSGDSDLNSIELSVDSHSKSYKWSFANEENKASVEEVFKGRRSLSEQIQWENICLQRKTSEGKQTEWDYKNRKPGTGNGFTQCERNDHKQIKGCKELLGSRGGQSCTDSTPDSPFGKASQGSSKRFNVDSGHQLNSNGGRVSKR